MTTLHTPEPLQLEPDWHRSATLAERGRVLRGSPPDGADKAEGDLARAARRLARWRAKAPLNRDDIFHTRLAQDGLTEAQLLRLLAEPAEALAARQGPPPEWVSRLIRLLRRPGQARVDLEQVTHGLSPAPAAFLALLEPLIADGRTRLEGRLRQVVAQQPHAPFEPAAVATMCLPALCAELSEVQARTLVLELNVARAEGLLAGETAQERFHSFIERLRQPEVALALFTEYPVLARQLVTTVDTWVTTNTELLERLAADAEVLRAALSPERELGVLTAFRPGLGDTHRGGRTVSALTFSSGLRLIYKPRSLAVDAHFQQLLAWLGERGASPRLWSPRVIDRGSYGWVEFVSRSPCQSPEEVRRFYERQGSYLALMYVLEATDLHFENIIAAGEHPVLIDLESLFHPHFQADASGDSSQRAAYALDDSVMRVALLPTRAWADESSEGADFSGLGSMAGQLSPRAAPAWHQVGTDEMRIIRKRVRMPGSDNRPVLEGAEVSVLEHTGAFEEGFRRMYRLLLAHREELLADGGPLSWFARDEVRIILRPTYFYHLILRESFHPDHLRDALDRERFFDRLWSPLDYFPETRRLIPFEREDFWQGDVPFFTSRPSSRDIWSSHGERLADYYPISGMELSRRCLERLSEEDLSRQLWFIQSSFASLAASEGRGLLPDRPRRQEAPPATRERLLARASAIGDRLAALAYRGEGSATWLGLVPVGNRYLAPGQMGTDLYGGHAGVALFLAWLGELTGQERYTQLAREALVTARRKLGDDPSETSASGAFGDGGYLHALVQLGALWREPALWDEAEALLPRLQALIARDTHQDVLWGAAGCGLVLRELYRCRPSPRVLELAVQCGERLLASAQPQEQGLGWITPLGPRPLTGLLHGASGIAWALCELTAATGQERFREAARSALAYERAHFSPEAGNWRDLRTEPSAGGFMVAMCQGAPGIGLARVLLLPHLDTEQVRGELSVALATTRARGFGGNHSLCHGDLGNLELLTLAAQALGDTELGRQRDRLAATVLAGMEETGVLCGVPSGVETPGLMMGLSGVGYALLRLAEPARVPSLLALEPPRVPERRD